MAGLFALSLHQVLDDFGRPIHGALAWFYEASTLTPLPVYVDYNVGVPGPNPWPADGYGRFPQIYLAEGGSGFYRFRVTSAEGAIIPGLDLQTLPVIGQSGGGGGGGPPVDPNSLTKTGDWVFAMSQDPRAGFVRANGLTIGSAASGASERPNADTEPLFTFLYNRVADTLCPVSGGRGASAAADFAANKRMTLPDGRGRALIGIETMGNVAAGRISSFTMTPDGLSLGAYADTSDGLILTAAQLPAHTHLISGTTLAGGGILGVFQLSGATGSPDNRVGTDGGTGIGAAINKMQPSLAGGYYIKL